MHPQNNPIKKALNEIADLLELQRADPVRVRAYRRASGIVAGLSASVRSMQRSGDELRDAHGLSEGLVPTIAELAETGSCTLLQRLHSEVPRELGVLLQLPHLGPKRVRTLHEELGVSSLADLHAAALAGQVQALPSFGPRLEHQLLRAVTAHMDRARRLRVDTVATEAARLVTWVGQLPQVSRVEIAGDLRRGCDSVAEIELVVESLHEREVVETFAAHPDVVQVSFSGLRSIGVTLRDGLGVNLHVAAADRFGACWLDRTGSPAHLRHLARVAARLRMSLDANGLARGGVLVAAASEEDIYAGLQLPWIAPELREARGELEAAAAGALPRLVQQADLAGDLRVRSRNGCMERDLRAIVDAARRRGLTYLAVADQARRLDMSRENDLTRLMRQMDFIDKLNAELTDFVVLKSLHVDILLDGRLNVPDPALARLDLVVGSVSDGFDLTRRRQTERLMRAMDNRYFSVLASPTGRLVEERRPYPVDLARLLRHARERACFAELDSDPARLDLDDIGCQLARGAGVLVTISSAADTPEALDNLRFGVVQARRGGLAAGDVLNTRSLPVLRELLAPTMRH